MWKHTYVMEWLGWGWGKWFEFCWRRRGREEGGYTKSKYL